MTVVVSLRDDGRGAWRGSRMSTWAAKTTASTGRLGRAAFASGSFQRLEDDGHVGGAWAGRMWTQSIAHI